MPGGSNNFSIQEKLYGRLYYGLAEAHWAQTAYYGGSQRIGVFSGEKFHHIYPNQDEVYIVDVVYLCKTYTGQLKAQKGEVERLRLFSADELPENISPPVRPVIEEWLTRKGV